MRRRVTRHTLRSSVCIQQLIQTLVVKHGTAHCVFIFEAEYISKMAQYCMMYNVLIICLKQPQRVLYFQGGMILQNCS